jgi:transcriptional regulator with XRE-family HTH domain
VSLNYISQLEKGKPKIQLDKLLDVLGVLGLELEVKPGNSKLVIGKGLRSE